MQSCKCDCHLRKEIQILLGTRNTDVIDERIGKLLSYIEECVEYGCGMCTMNLAEYHNNHAARESHPKQSI